MFRKTRNVIQDAIFIITFLMALRGLALLLKDLIVEGVYRIRRRKNPDLLPPL